MSLLETVPLNLTTYDDRKIDIEPFQVVGSQNILRSYSRDSPPSMTYSRPVMEIAERTGISQDAARQRMGYPLPKLFE